MSHINELERIVFLGLRKILIECHKHIAYGDSNNIFYRYKDKEVAEEIIKQATHLLTKGEVKCGQ